MNKNAKAHLALFCANLIYGANYTIAKEVMPAYIQPFGFVLLRVIGAFLMFWLLHALIIREKVDKIDYLKLAICGLFGVAINQVLFLEMTRVTVGFMNCCP
ncbi:MAG: EamA family transporter [Candidatus Heimdallarchaeota archaeon]|nr:EamA family transporter [Candidatus Heimdallarchaeota archaeon]